MRILLIGGTGVLGRAALPLLTADHDVTVASRRQQTDPQIRRAGATPVRLDPFDTRALARVADQVQPEAVVRLATHIPTGGRALLPWAWRENDRIRRDLSALLADVAIAHEARYVGESLILAYPDRGASHIAEDTSLEPVGQTATVAAAEAAAERVTAAGSVGVSLRFGLFHGPGSGQAERTVEAAARGLLPLPGDDDGYVSLIDVGDAAHAVRVALGLPAGSYNVVEDEPATRAEHAAELARVLERPVRTPPGFVGRLPMVRPLARSLRVSNHRLREHGWQPQVPRAVDDWTRIAREVAGVAG